MSFTIRSIEEQDFKDLITLFKEFALFEKLPDKMQNNYNQMKSDEEFINGFVAINEHDEIVGYVTFFYAYYTWIGKSLYMDDLYIKQSVRGEGLGTLLINKVIELARIENCKKIKWQVSKWNQPAINLYKSLGATLDDVEMNCDLIL